MAKKPSDQSSLLRMAIKEVLDLASEPLTVVQISEHMAVASYGLPIAMTHSAVNDLYNLQDQPFPMQRIPSNRGDRCRYAYFNPDVVKLAYKKPERSETVAPPAAPVNTVKPFDFNPIELETQSPPAPAAEATVSAPAGVKSITLTVSGVTVRIDLA